MLLTGKGKQKLQNFNIMAEAHPLSTEGGKTYNTKFSGW